MSIECQYMSNICQTYVKHKRKANGITRLIEEIKENRRKGLGVPLGLKVQRLRVQGSEDSKTLNIMQHHETDEVSRTQRFEGFGNSSVVS